MFRRTAAGISNQPLFLDVDIIVFVEGSGKTGKTFSKAQAYAGKSNPHSIDVIFWQTVFSIFHPGPRLKFRPIGSKSTLISIGEDIVSGKAKNVYVAMDRDFQLKGPFIQGKGIFYTYGYSWENDVWQPEVLQDVITALCCTKISSRQISAVKKKLIASYKVFAKEVRHVVFADAFLCSDGAAFIPRDQHMRCLIIRSKQLPKLNVAEIEKIFQRLNVSREEAVRFGKKYKIRPLKDCLGHLLSDFCYHLEIYFLRVMRLPSIAKDYMMGVAIDKFKNRLEKQELVVLYDHYQNSFSQS